MTILPIAFGCSTGQQSVPLVGTWELVAATSSENGQTTSTFDPNRKMIKIINDTHFAFLNHDTRAVGDSTAAPFSAGGGRYTLTGDAYTEYLDYFNDKQWEGNKFDFTITFLNDTLVQRGVEKVEKAGVDHIIVEKYKRVK
ncbi:lipocalin family protein [Fibrella arboris]|uniref:lipocalin family protein n=1 Tax=Fibrella arboris TaxID=3242486 RepID=UPI0035221187